MIKLAVPAIAAIFALGGSLSAQETTVRDAVQPASLTLNQSSPSEMVEGRAALGEAGAFRSLHNAWCASGPLTFVDGRLFSFPRAFGWVEAREVNFLPAFTLQQLPRVTPGPTSARSASKENSGVFQKPDYVGGEVGVFYGRSTGKYSREVEQGYILGEIVDGNTHILVGASYGHSSGNSPRIIGR